MHEQRAEQERNAPAEREELRVGERVAQQQEDAARAEKAERRAELREHAVPRALAGWCVLGREQHRAAPFAAEAEPLAETAQREQQRRGDADRGIGRQHADHDGRQAHRQQRSDERRLAPDAVAEMAEHGRADRPCEECERERRERLQGRRCGIARREEQLRKHEHRGGRVDVEIEEFDRRAGEAGREHTPFGIADLRHALPTRERCASCGKSRDSGRVLRNCGDCDNAILALLTILDRKISMADFSPLRRGREDHVLASPARGGSSAKR